MENKFFREGFQQSVFHCCVTVQCPLLGQQHINISGWCSDTFILHIFGQFERNLVENAIGK